MKKIAKVEWPCEIFLNEKQDLKNRINKIFETRSSKQDLQNKIFKTRSSKQDLQNKIFETRSSKQDLQSMTASSKLKIQNCQHHHDHNGSQVGHYIKDQDQKKFQSEMILWLFRKKDLKTIFTWPRASLTMSKKSENCDVSVLSRLFLFIRPRERSLRSKITYRQKPSLKCNNAK